MAASPVDLTTVPQVQAQGWDGSPPATLSATLIQVVITAISRHIMVRTGREVLNGVQQVIELLDGSGSDKQFCRNYPIQTIQSLFVFNSSVLPSPDGLNPGYLVGDSYAASVTLLPGTAIGGPVSYSAWLMPLGKFPRGRQNVKITTYAGYVISGWAASTAYPLNTGLKDPNGNIQQATVAGTSGSSQPTWNTVVGGTTVDNAITWTNRGPGAAAGSSPHPPASPVFNGAPDDLGQAVTEFVVQQLKRRDWVDQVSKTMAQTGQTVSFSQREIPPWLEMVIQNYKRTWPV